MKKEFMERAIELSINSVNTGGGPFGCVVVKGDKIISENYLQHADHFTRILNSQEASKIINLEKNNSTDTKIDENNNQTIVENDNKKNNL